MVKRGEALNDGLPRDNVVQDEQILCGVGQMSLDPLGRERVLKCLCYHGMDLWLGCRETPFRHYPTDQRSQKHALGEKISGYYVESHRTVSGREGTHWPSESESARGRRELAY